MAGDMVAQKLTSQRLTDLEARGQAWVYSGSYSQLATVMGNNLDNEQELGLWI